MANKQLLSEAIEAFINRDENVAAKKLRAFFVESAQEINKKMEEDFDAEADGEELQEDLNADPQEDLTNEIGYKLDEEDKEGEEADADAIFANDEAEAADEADVDAGVEGEFPEEEVPAEDVRIDSNEWADIKAAFSDLEALFADIEAEDDEAGDEEADDSVEGGDEFDGVSFGDEKFGESFKLKEVPAVDKTEKAGVQKKSPVPANAKSVVPGVKPATTVASGTPNDKTFDNKEHEAVKVDDRGNVLKSDKDIQKPAKAPKNAPVSAKSPVPSKK